MIFYDYVTLFTQLVSSIYEKSNKAFEEEKLRWENYIDLTTNGVAKMVGKYKGVKA